ncbi:hypothetical protein Tco_0679644 [Tanacetum coccineum]|uniref:Uncharacterized protein n=1 Tax=Tanacetum coccineum TaxID=301880 RepID=A0ABQ4XJM3_9ASTR
MLSCCCPSWVLSEGLGMYSVEVWFLLPGVGGIIEIPWPLISREVMKLATGRLVNGSSCDRIDMVIKNLDLEPKVDAMMRDFLYPFQWKELSKESGSKILPCGDGSCWKMFKPIASLIAKGKLK